MTQVTLLYFDGCPNWRTADHRLGQLADELPLTIDRQQVTTTEEAERWGFRGSPTLLVDGIDPFVTGEEPTGLACRIYPTEDGPQGAPSLAQLRAVLS